MKYSLRRPRKDAIPASDFCCRAQWCCFPLVWSSCFEGILKLRPFAKHGESSPISYCIWSSSQTCTFMHPHFCSPNSCYSFQLKSNPHFLIWGLFWLAAFVCSTPRLNHHGENCEASGEVINRWLLGRRPWDRAHPNEEVLGWSGMVVEKFATWKFWGKLSGDPTWGHFSNGCGLEIE